MKQLQSTIILILIAVIVLMAWALFETSAKSDSNNRVIKEPNVTHRVDSFMECVKAGLPVQESYPRKCSNGLRTFTEDIGNSLELRNEIFLTEPLANETIDSPLMITGEARGYWFFEASFPIQLTNWDGLIIAEGIATAEGDWMTADFVPFTASLEFTVPDFGERGSLILQKDNPSGLPENDAALEIPVFFDIPEAIPTDE